MEHNITKRNFDHFSFYDLKPFLWLLSLLLNGKKMKYGFLKANEAQKKGRKASGNRIGKRKLLQCILLLGIFFRCAVELKE